MTMQVRIPDVLAEQLQRHAEAIGSGPEQFAVAAIRRRIHAEEQLAQVLAPVRKAFAASGMTEEELGDLLENAKQDMRAERQSRNGQ